MSKHLGPFVRARRKEIGLSVREFGKKVGMSNGAISGVEGGKDTLATHRLSAFAEALLVDDMELRVREAADRGKIEVPDGANLAQVAAALHALGLEVATTKERMPECFECPYCHRTIAARRVDG